MFEKEAEEIAKDIYIHHFDDDVNYPEVLKAITVGVQKGAEFGYNKAKDEQGDEIESAYREGVAFGKDKAHGWHDLRKNPMDLPSRSDENKDKSNRVITDKGIGFYYFRKEKWYTSEGDEAYCFERKITAWCEIPRFEVEADSGVENA